VTRQASIARRAEQLLGAAVVSTAPLAGGQTTTATKLRLNDGSQAVMKTLPRAPETFFPAEARGLRALGAVDGGVPVPEVLAAEPDCLIVRWVEHGKPSEEAADRFGRALAHTHAAGRDSFGAEADGFVGRLPLPNTTAGSWPEFYATRRVLPYLKAARDRGAVFAPEAEQIEAATARVAELVPAEPPALLHGDLWNGNVLWAAPDAGGSGGIGRAHVIDPASYAGHREADLATLALFGLPHLDRVMSAYQAERPLAEGWEERLGLHQLFPLLVRAVLFGGGYGARAAEVAARYL
jgi:fructosamine-3-kinase